MHWRTDAALFNIDRQTGAVTFKAALTTKHLLVAAPPAMINNITVTASDGALTTAAQAVTITVTNVTKHRRSSAAPSDRYLGVNQALSGKEVASLFTDVEPGYADLLADRFAQYFDA